MYIKTCSLAVTRHWQSILSVDHFELLQDLYWKATYIHGLAGGKQLCRVCVCGGVWVCVGGWVGVPEHLCRCREVHNNMKALKCKTLSVNQREL